MPNSWFGSVYSGARSEPSVNQMADQVVNLVIASSVTPKDVNDALLSQETTYCMCIWDLVGASFTLKIVQNPEN